MRGESRHVPSRPRSAGRATERAASGAASGKDNAAETARLTRVLEPVVRAAGLDLESVRVAAAGRRRLLRIVVDGDGGPGGTGRSRQNGTGAGPRDAWSASRWRPGRRGTRTRYWAGSSWPGRTGWSWRPAGSGWSLVIRTW